MESVCFDYNNRSINWSNRLYIFSWQYKRMMFGMEPEEISSLYEEHSTVIQSVREGLLSLINMA